MKMSSFWGHFEEDAKQTKSETFNLGQTLTRQREEPDQDTGNNSFRTIPCSAITETQTLTEQREEPDQDMSQIKYSIIPF